MLDGGCLLPTVSEEMSPGQLRDDEFKPNYFEPSAQTRI